MESYYGIIYKATNKDTVKIYIGMTTRTLDERRIEHHSKAKKESNNIFHKIIRKNLLDFEEDNFYWEVIDGAKNKEELLEKETYWITYYNTFIGFENCKGYNMTIGGEGYCIGEDNPQSQLNEKQVLEILNDIMSGSTHKEISKLHNVAHHLIETLSQGKTYRCYYTADYKTWLKEKREKELLFIRDTLPKIFKELMDGKSHKSIARKFNTHKSNITNISRGVNFKQHFCPEYIAWLREKEKERGFFIHDILPKIIDDIMLEQYQHKELAKKYKVSVKTIQGILYEGFHKEHWPVKYISWLENKQKSERIFIQDTLPKIINEIMNGSKQTQIARKYGIGYSTVKNVSQGVAYKNHYPNKYRLWLSKRRDERETFIEKIVPSVIKDIMNNEATEIISINYNLEIGIIQRIARGQVFRKYYTPDYINWLEETKKNKCKGISYKKNKGKWEAYARVDSKMKYLGMFYSKEHAIIARLKFEKEYFGENAPQKHLFERYEI
ncbi:GIY-YIG nuclease family protein [Metabacillus hrfriensis]|uniref:GIY-YIG nuclease family protein n=1 Tax=Metabacillus hrfriensis TaxID=3048891 RepID=A0ACD4RHS9_9BACI|nr:GIY-YIG nuclease family protein [Metabacillus sp. CT-WN-B3]WHZ60037.1 GIY-YIG nuclease family protein [Metabacillus sp. CT-WN-B3]